jgi:hypothetical protein
MPFADCFNERSGDLVRLEGLFCSASLRSNFVEGGMMMRRRRRRPGTVNPRSLTKDRDLSIHPLVRTEGDEGLAAGKPAARRLQICAPVSCSVETH